MIVVPIMAALWNMDPHSFVLGKSERYRLAGKTQAIQKPIPSDSRLGKPLRLGGWFLSM